jgi:hypothetical protein
MIAVLPARVARVAQYNMAQGTAHVLDSSLSQPTDGLRPTLLHSV